MGNYPVNKKDPVIKQPLGCPRKWMDQRWSDQWVLSPQFIPPFIRNGEISHWSDHLWSDHFLELPSISTLPETNSSPLNMGHPERKLIFQPSNIAMENGPFEDIFPIQNGIFHCSVSFREGSDGKTSAPFKSQLAATNQAMQLTKVEEEHLEATFRRWKVVSGARYPVPGN